MRDEMDARMWNEHGHQFSEDLHRLLTRIRAAVRTLARPRLRAIRGKSQPTC